MAVPPPPAWLTDGERPVLMAIGDSLLNGMRSLSIDDSLARLSIPAEVGRSLRPPPGFAPFVPARYPQTILLQIEDMLRQRVTSVFPPAGLVELVAAVNGPDGIRSQVRRNARAWAARLAGPPPSRPGRFDNLAMNGARLPDVFGTRFAQVEARWAAMRQVIETEDDPFAWRGALPPGDPYGDDRAHADQPAAPPGDPLLAQPDSWGLADVHITLNIRHLFNPESGPGLEAYRVIDIVHARRPHVLLLDIGPNHGLSDICLSGAGERGIARLERFGRLWPACAAELAATPELGLAVVLLPPLPSQIPALMPPQTEDPRAPEPSFGAAYHPFYVSALSFQPPGREYSEAEVRGFDAAVQAVSAGMRVAAQAAFDAAGKPVAFVDLAALLHRHDAKNGRGAAFVPDPASGIAYDNRCIGQRVPFGANRLRGGIGSLDNFHPSTLGYRYVARAVVEAIGERLPGLVASLPAVTSAGDTLLSDPPWGAINTLGAFWPFAQGLAGPAAVPGSAQAAEQLLRLGGLR